MPALSLPLTFNNSFWSQDYRCGLEVLFDRLIKGVFENSEIISLIRERADAEAKLAASLLSAAPIDQVGFSNDDGASFIMAFRGLQEESSVQGRAHLTISKELDTLVADPFEYWAQGYSERINSKKHTVLDNWIKSYEQARGSVAKLKQQYLDRTRRADEAEDNAKFSPGAPLMNDATDPYTTSPKSHHAEGRVAPHRTPSVSERIAQRLKEIQKTNFLGPAISSSLGENEKVSMELNVDKGEGTEVEDKETTTLPVEVSPCPLSTIALPESSLSLDLPVQAAFKIADISISPKSLSLLLQRAAAELPLNPVRFPLLGEYQDCFTGDQFAAWLCYNVPDLDRNLDRAEEAAKDLTEREGLLRRIGELGNQFEASDDAFYQFRPKAFNLSSLKAAPTNTTLAPLKNLQTDTLIQRTGNFVDLVTKAINSNNNEPAYLRARRDAEEADNLYRISVRALDRQRLGLEEKIEDTLKLLQRFELERLRAVKTVLLQYQGTLANLPKSLDSSLERSSTLIASFQPESDLTALIERYRTGPFRPNPQVYESVSHEELDVVFGIDLRRWAEGNWYELSSDNEKKKETVPLVLTALLNALINAYGRLPNDAEKRKSWIYDVSLPAVHNLRETLNTLTLEKPFAVEDLIKYDAPILASTVKLWLLELNPPVALYEGWDDLRKLYPSLGSSFFKGEKLPQEHTQNLGTALQKLPRVHLYVLDAIVKHLRNLIDATTVEESDEIYITKLALSIGRTIMRPKIESEFSIQDRHPTLLLIDLLTNYDEILPPTIERKKRESERRLPVRKRTALVDMRLSRSRISSDADAHHLLAVQHAKGSSLGVTSPEISFGTRSPASTSAPSPVVPPHSPSILEHPVSSPPPPPPPLLTQQTPQFIPLLPSDRVIPTTFKEPLVETEVLLNRPTFKEPPPELPSPTHNKLAFSKPSRETPTSLATSTAPRKRGSLSSDTTSPPMKPVSPPPDDQVLSTGHATLSRAGSGGLRGPRRGPRPPGTGNVSNLVNSLNSRSKITGSPPTSPLGRTSHKSSGAAGRTSSVLGRSTAFSRRTMSSDAEDDVVDRK